MIVAYYKLKQQDEVDIALQNSFFTFSFFFVPIATEDNGLDLKSYSSP